MIIPHIIHNNIQLNYLQSPQFKTAIESSKSVIDHFRNTVQKTYNLQVL